MSRKWTFKKTEFSKSHVKSLFGIGRAIEYEFLIFGFFFGNLCFFHKTVFFEMQVFQWKTQYCIGRHSISDNCTHLKSRFTKSRIPLKKNMKIQWATENIKKSSFHNILYFCFHFLKTFKINSPANTL